MSFNEAVPQSMSPEEALAHRCRFFLRYLHEQGLEAASRDNYGTYVKRDIHNDQPVAYFRMSPKLEMISRGLQLARVVRVYLPVHTLEGDQPQPKIAWFEDRQPEAMDDIVARYEVTETSFGPEESTESDIEAFAEEKVVQNSLDKHQHSPDLGLLTVEEVLADRDPRIQDMIYSTQHENVDGWHKILRRNFEITSFN